eukprot:SAG31_NODE_3489_length_4207_cov_1.962512_2_plen_63_part_00
MHGLTYRGGSLEKLEIQSATWSQQTRPQCGPLDVCAYSGSVFVDVGSRGSVVRRLLCVASIM